MGWGGVGVKNVEKMTPPLFWGSKVTNLFFLILSQKSVFGTDSMGKAHVKDEKRLFPPIITYLVASTMRFWQLY